MISRRFLAILVLLVGGSLSASELTQNEAKLKVMQQRIRQLQQELKAEHGQRDTLRQQLEQDERAIASTRRALADTKTQLSKQNQRLDALRTQTEKQRVNLHQRRQQLSRLVRARYMAGPQEPMRLLLNREDPAMVDRMFTYYRYVAQARSDQLNRISAELAALEQAEQELALAQRELKILHAAQEKQQRRLEAKLEQRRLLLAKLNRRITGDDQQLRRLREDAKHLTGLLLKLRQQLSDLPEPGSGFAAMRGRLPLPVAAPIKARFGQARNVPGTYWRGVLFQAAAGTPVKAIYGGRVVYADWLRGFGLLLIIDHGQGYMSLYSHNQELLKGVGSVVTRGEKVALVGDSGGLAQAGLYFELRHNGTPRDPLRWCKLSK